MARRSSLLPLLLSLLALAVPAAYAGKLPPKVLVGGIFPAVMASGDLDAQSISVRAATELALKHVNADSSILQETDLALISRDDNRDEGNAIFKAMELCDDLNATALIGSWTSGASKNIQYVARRFGVPQISYVAQSTSLSDKIAYPTFMRMVAPNFNQARGLAWMCKNAFKWERVGLLYDDGVYGMDGAKDFMRAALEFGLHIVSPQVFSVVGTDLTNLKLMLGEMVKSNVKVFVIWSNRVDKAVRAASEMGIIGKGSGYQWVGSQEVLTPAFRTGSNQDLVQYFDGMIGIKARLDTTSKQYLDLFPKWTARVQGVDFPAGNWEPRSWSNAQKQYVKDPKATTLYNAGGNVDDGTLVTYDSSRDTTMNVYAAMGYEAVWTIAYAVDNMYKNNATFIRTLTDDKGDFTSVSARKQFSDLMLKWLYATNYNGVTGNVAFNAQGDRFLMPFNLHYLSNGNEVQWAQWNRNDFYNSQVPGTPVMWADGRTGVENAPLDRELCQPGSYSVNGGCSPCPTDHYTDAKDMFECKTCESGYGTNGATGQAACVFTGQFMQTTGCEQTKRRDNSDPSTTVIIFLCSALGVIAFMYFILFTSNRFRASR